MTRSFISLLDELDREESERDLVTAQPSASAVGRVDDRWLDAADLGLSLAHTGDDKRGSAWPIDSPQGAAGSLALARFDKRGVRSFARSLTGGLPPGRSCAPVTWYRIFVQNRPADGLNFASPRLNLYQGRIPGEEVAHLARSDLRSLAWHKATNLKNIF
ncbi:hypothetical protein ZHAS_00013372 [Anopheles sinensis]|uniref:Uncharacterized protein n=1 Tax=Anopheles sinensis TaxID=74873 RepID=A0A084W5E5_ANOSI|nr:hypothetical protein ZHAS_00013372 [Anopheles sinensis]